MFSATELKNCFESSYDRKQWISVLRENFGLKEAFTHPKLNKFTTKQDLSEGYFVLGRLTTIDGREIGIYELQVNSQVKIERNKVGLRNLLKEVYSNDVDAAFVVFDQQKKWRFSYVSELTIRNKEGKREKKKTDPKRYTYLMGEGERCKTAADRFSKIITTDDLFGKGVNLTTLEEAFNVEKMSKAFFNEYRKQYGYFVAYLTGKDENSKAVGKSHPFLKSIFNGNEKEARDFVKKMLGRIVFLYFLEKKGWLGVPQNKNWGEGDENFLSNLFKDCKDKEGFYPLVLGPLYFKTLNKENRPNEQFETDPLLFSKPGYDKLRIPYLNGGLFDDDEPHTDIIVFQPQLFEKLFQFFDQYNFTVYEDSPDEHTVAVDPEMLGHIFENLLEDNKDKGAFYTPKEIVHYMCRETLIEYLYTSLNPDQTHSFKEIGVSQTDMFGKKAKKQLSIIETVNKPNEKLARAYIERFVLNHEAKDIIDYDKEILSALKNVKICDPAIGSGAFPMGLLTEIFHLVETLYDASPDVTEKVWVLTNGWNPAQVKESIIQNSIYGVDIEKGAVDIARLRFWLSLVVDEDRPKPLPNLDYKIVVGNSLLSKFENEVINIEWKIRTKNVSNVEKIINDQQVKLHLLQTRQHLYFLAKGEKAKLQNEIRELKIAVLVNQLTLERIAYAEKNQIQHTTFSSEKARESENKIIKRIKEYNRTIQKLETLRSNKTQIIDFFDWKLNFPEVMNEKLLKGSAGFDIVIGNPPYIGERKNKEVFFDVQKSKNAKYYLGRMDYFYFFYHLSLDLLKHSGTGSIISTNYFPTAMGANKLRRDLKERSSILKIVNFNEGKVFDSAFGQHNMILNFKSGAHDVKCSTTVIKSSGFLDSQKLRTILSSEENGVLKDVFKIDQKSLWDGNENYLRIAGITNDTTSINANSIINKILDKSIHFLGNICSPLIGLESSLDQVYVVKKDEVKSIIYKESEKNLFKPFFKSSDIQRYSVSNKTDYYILYLHENIDNIQSYKGVWTYLKNHEDKIKNRKGANLRGAFRRGNWWVLNTPRLDMDFKDEKIVTPYRSKNLRFALSNEEWYASRDVYYIVKKNKDINLKYILGLLNSKLYYTWYYNRGKRKGDMLELYAKPLKETPIYLADVVNQNIVISLVTDILELYKSESIEKAKLQERRLDFFIYKLYHLTYEEACYVEGNSNWMMIENYEKFQF